MHHIYSNWEDPIPFSDEIIDLNLENEREIQEIHVHPERHERITKKDAF